MKQIMLMYAIFAVSTLCADFEWQGDNEKGFHASLRVSPDAPHLDEEMHLDLRVECPSSYTFDYETMISTLREHMHVDSSHATVPLEKDGVVVQQVSATMSLWKLGGNTFPFIPITWCSQKRDQKVTILSDAFRFKVEPPRKIPGEPKPDPSLLPWDGKLPIELNEANKQKLKERDLVREQKPLPILDVQSPSWIWFYVLCAGVILFFLNRISFFRKQRVQQKEDPQKKALHALEVLIGEKLLEKGLIEPFYVRLTGICRTFMEEKYDIRAPELTTEEFLIELAVSPHFEAETKQRLKEFLDQADLVKFARKHVSINESEQMVKLARGFIQAAR